MWGAPVRPDALVAGRHSIASRLAAPSGPPKKKPTTPPAGLRPQSRLEFALDRQGPLMYNGPCHQKARPCPNPRPCFFVDPQAISASTLVAYFFARLQNDKGADLKLYFAILYCSATLVNPHFCAESRSMGFLRSTLPRLLRDITIGSTLRNKPQDLVNTSIIRTKYAIDNQAD